MIGIYKITSPSGKIYIGQAFNIQKRIKRYSKLNCKGQPRLYNSFLKHGVDQHTFEIIEECIFDQLNIRERHWQDFYDVTSDCGLNCNLTATNICKKVYSEETRLKMSKSAKQRKSTEKSREKIREFMLTNNPFKGKKHSQASLKKISENSSKYILINTQTKEVFYGLKKAALSVGVSASHLRKAIIGELENNTNLIQLHLYKDNSYYKQSVGEVKKDNNIKVKNTKTGEIIDSILEASKHVECSYAHFTKMLRGIRTNKTNYIII